MAFVARNDQHGNEIMRVMLSTEPGKLTVASCQNLRINCGPQSPLTSCSEGRYDHRRRFHYYADDSQSWRQRQQKSHSVAEPIAQREREKERERTHKRLREKQSLSDDDSTAWNSVEINAHSTLVSARNSKSKDIAIPQRESSTHFHSWLAEKNKSKQQQEENRRLAAQQKDRRAEERARLAHEKYRSWLNAKSSTKVRRAKSDLSSVLASTTTSRQSLPADEAQRRLHNWQREKLEKLKAQRQQRKDIEEKQQLMESARRELSAEAWEQWVDAAKSKPRPVPMGQGLDSLRGSLAPLYTNPNEWQPIVGNTRRHSQQAQAQQSQQSQQPQSTTARNGPDYDRLERLAQPRRKQCRPTPRGEKLNESPKLLEENSADKSASHLGDKSRATDAESNATETLRSPSIATENDEEQLELEEPSQLTQPRGKPIIWSENNAQRVRELREVLNPQEAEMPRQLRDDQVEQLRKHQDLQNSKILPRKYQVKREKLREKLKAWVEEGKLLPERLAVDEDKGLVQAPKQEAPKEISQHDSNTNASKGQRSEDQVQSTTRKSVSTELRARSTDPIRLLKLKEKEKESKGTPKSRPWR